MTASGAQVGALQGPVFVPCLVIVLITGDGRWMAAEPAAPVSFFFLTICGDCFTSSSPSETLTDTTPEVTEWGNEPCSKSTGQALDL